MNKLIEFYISGDVNILFESKIFPEGVMLEKHSEKKSGIYLENKEIELYSQVKNILESLKDKVSYSVVFSSNSFTEEECDKAELLFFFPRSIDGIGLLKRYDTVYDMWKETKLNLFSREKPVGLFIATGGGLHLFHEKLIDKLKKENLVKGINFIPVLIEYNKNEISGWFYGYADNDLGDYIRGKELFLHNFERARWHGEDFNTSSIYSDNMLIVSNKVYRFFNKNVKKEDDGMDFKPIELY